MTADVPETIDEVRHVKTTRNRIDFEAKLWKDGTISRAWFDETRVYRYKLERDFRAGDGAAETHMGEVAFIMLNPSTADANINDPTVTRCCNFAHRWGYRRITVLNLFALRSTDPIGLRAVGDPVGPANDEMIVTAASMANMVVCAWGVRGAYLDRERQVVELLRHHDIPLHALRLTKAGYPHHPLYLPQTLKPVPYRPEMLSSEGLP